MAESQKLLSVHDHQQNLQFAFNMEEKTFGVDGFLAGKVGHKITRVLHSVTEEDYSYYDGSSLLMTLRITYVDSSLEVMVSAERIA